MLSGSLLKTMLGEEVFDNLQASAESALQVVRETDARLTRIERKLDALLDGLGISADVFEQIAGQGVEEINHE